MTRRRIGEAQSADVDVHWRTTALHLSALRLILRGTRLFVHVVSTGCGLAEAYEREMPEWRHRLALKQTDIVPRSLGPAREPLPREIGLPAEPARHRLEPALEGEARSGLGPNPIEEHDLSTGLQHARELV